MWQTTVSTKQSAQNVAEVILIKTVRQMRLNASIAENNTAWLSRVVHFTKKRKNNQIQNYEQDVLSEAAKALRSNTTSLSTPSSIYTRNEVSRNESQNTVASTQLDQLESTTKAQQHAVPFEVLEPNREMLLEKLKTAI